MFDDVYWLVKTGGGWAVQDRCQIFAVHATLDDALAHRDRLASSCNPEAPAAKAPALPDMPPSDAFCRRFS